MQEDFKKKKKLYELIKSNLQKIIITLLSLFYIVQGLYSFAKKDGDLLEILGSMGLAVLFGMAISVNFNSLGLTDGRNGELYQKSLSTYGKAKVDATPFFDKLPSWCSYKNKQELEFAKKDMIQEAGLYWKAYRFGYYAEHTEKLTDEQKEVLAKIEKLKLPKLTTQELLSDLPRNIIGRRKYSKFGEEVGDYNHRSMATGLMLKIGTGVLSGMYTLIPLMTETNKAEMLSGLIWNCFQVMIWLAFGIMQYSNAKSFIEDEYRQTHIVQKTEYLNEFVITMKNNPSVIDTYDDDIREIDGYIQDFINKRKENEQE